MPDIDDIWDDEEDFAVFRRSRPTEPEPAPEPTPSVRDRVLEEVLDLIDDQIDELDDPSGELEQLRTKVRALKNN